MESLEWPQQYKLIAWIRKPSLLSDIPVKKPFLSLQNRYCVLSNPKRIWFQQQRYQIMFANVHGYGFTLNENVDALSSILIQWKREWHGHCYLKPSTFREAACVNWGKSSKCSCMTVCKLIWFTWQIPYKAGRWTWHIRWLGRGFTRFSTRSSLF